MANYIRRLVSGDKARFKDGKLNMELDLVYLTDHVIIMGYPASGIEGLYRNRREDAKRFLEHRHGKNYWIFNFCPIRENSYDPSFFDGRVSRYPYPDHHAPPLAVMPLLAREMRAWLNGSPDRVAVLHCKAGKGRSGTMACSYLLTLDDGPSPPQLERSYSAKQWAKIRAEDVLDSVPEDIDDDSTTKQVVPNVPEEVSSEGTPQQVDSLIVMSPTSVSPKPAKSFADSLKDVLDLHTSRRMKAPSSPGKKVKQGVSIPSQRRWLYYWSSLLAGEAPAHLWRILPPNPTGGKPGKLSTPKVRLTEIKLRMKESSGMKINLVRAANIVMDRTNMAKGVTTATGNGYGHVWVSLARYDDELVDVLETWEKQTRNEDHMGRRKKGTEHMGDEELSQIFGDGRWDDKKMVRSFARLGPSGDDAVVKGENEKDGKTLTYTLRPLTDQKWDNFRDELQQEGVKSGLNPEEANVPVSETNSMDDLTLSAKERGVVLEAGREVRVKLYMGQVFMGWIWFVPTFHMPQGSAGQQTIKFKLTRKEVDFPLGIGSEILDVEISLEWLKETDVEVVQPPARLSSQEEVGKGMGDGPSGITAALHAAAEDSLESALAIKQATEN